MKNKTKLLFVIIIAVIITLFTYKIYAPYSIQNFTAVNLENINKIKKTTSSDTFSFAVLGNIENSISIFDKKILKKLQENKVDFIVSTGNNVINSGRGKYRVLNRTLQKMKIPFVTGAGENEINDGGYKNFYKYFGPFYFSFSVQNSYFIFLDTTDHSSEEWQREWLVKELKSAQDYKYRFVIMNKAPLKISSEQILNEEIKYITDEEEREYYQNIFSKYRVNSVFSSNTQLYYRDKIKGVNYIISGGAGGELLIENPRSFYHYVLVQASPEGINYKLQKLEGNPGLFTKIIVNIWVGLQSFLYTNYINIIIIALILFMIGFLFYRELNREIDYYRNFSYTEDLDENKILKIAMFTNNYFPVIGGVPISINRLAKGLERLGHQVYIFAPQYPDRDDRKKETDLNIFRCKLLYYFRKKGMDMPICNTFNKALDKKFKSLDIDLVHCHHPFILGTKGLSLARKEGIPAVFTYHTRLEKYAHYLPGILFFRKLFANRISHFIIKRFANKCNAVFAPTNSTREYLRNIGVRRHIKVLPTGVELQNYNYNQQELSSLKKKYKKNNELLLITVSRLSKEKNLYFLLAGLKAVKEKSFRKFKCLIIGDGSEKENLQEYARKTGLNENVKFMGELDHQLVNKYYLISDIFVFSSTTETQGMVLLEAMAGNTPVVAVRSSGTDDVIKNGFNGYKTAEDMSKWAEKVIKLMENNGLLTETSGNARKMAEKYSVENMACEAERLYHKLIN